MEPLDKSEFQKTIQKFNTLYSFYDRLKNRLVSAESLARSFPNASEFAVLPEIRGMFESAYVPIKEISARLESGKLGIQDEPIIVQIIKHGKSVGLDIELVLEVWTYDTLDYDGNPKASFEEVFNAPNK
jgi:hypothetical protein